MNYKHDEVIYFFTEDFSHKNEHKMKKCPCDDPDCKLVIFDNGFNKDINLPANVLQVDFINKRKI